MNRMKKLIVLMAIMAFLAGSLGGCATTSDSKAYYEAALASMEFQKPLLLLEAKDGEKIELSGVKTLAVYAPGHGLPQYVDPWTGVVRDGIVAVTGLGSVYLGLQGAVNLVDATGKIAGRNVNYGTGSFQGNQGPGTYGSPNSAVLNAGGSPVSSPASASFAPVTDNSVQNPVAP